jgi:hypothetical protein
VVAYPTGGIPEILTDEQTGFLVHPMSPQALAERILTLVLQRPERLEAAAEQGRAMWRERFGVERYQLEVIEVLARAMRVAPPQALLREPAASTPESPADRDGKPFRRAAAQL